MRILISGGPGSGCTTTAISVGERLGLPVLDSDDYFHKPSDPPFQAQYTPDERRSLLGPVLNAGGGWILSGSIATWDLDAIHASHGVFLDISAEVRLPRLLARQRDRFGTRIDREGDMQGEHEAFMKWAAGYDVRTGAGRNHATDLRFLQEHCPGLIEIREPIPMAEVISKISRFLQQG